MKKLNIMFFILFCHTISLLGQGALHAIPHHIVCPEITSGSFSLTLASSVIQEYDLPFRAEYENLDNGDFEEFQFNSSSYFLADLAAGNYKIIINLDESCSIEYEGEITSTININLVLKKEDPTFANDCQDGFLDLRIDGGVPPYDIVWESLQSITPLITEVVKVSNGVSGMDGQEDLENAEVGSYRVMVTDALCDPIFASLPLSCECGEGCDVVGEITNAYCGNLGAISLGLNCGGNMMPIQSYIWSDGNESGNREDLMPGEYCVTVTDEEGCEFEECFIINSGERSASMVTLLDIEHVTSCNYAEVCGEVGCTSDGSLSISVNSNEPYTLSWSGPNNFSSNQEELSNLKVGSYFLEVDFESPSICDLVETYLITSCRTIVYDDYNNECLYGNFMVDLELNNRTQVSNAMPCSGTIDISFTGGVTNGFEFQWEGPNGFMSHSEDLTDLCESEYCIFVDDGCNGEENYCFDIVNCDNADINIQGELSNTCPDVDFGSIDVFVQGGRMPYTYEWSNGATIQNLERLFAGTYVVTVTDFNGCVETAEFIVTSEISIMEEPRSTTECNQYFTCSGERINELTIEIGFAGCEFSEEDCRFEICTCNDGFQLDPINRGLRPLQRDIFDDCRLVQYCFNNEEYLPARIQGTFTTKTEEQLDDIDETPGADKTVWFCCNLTGCIFPPGYEEWNVTIDRDDGLLISIAGQPGDGVGCTIVGTCNGVDFYDKHFPGDKCIEEIIPVRGDCNLIEISPNSIESIIGEIEQAEIDLDDTMFQPDLDENIKTTISKVYPNPFSNDNINLSRISQSGLLFLVLLDEKGSQFHFKIIKL